MNFVRESYDLGNNRRELQEIANLSLIKTNAFLESVLQAESNISQFQKSIVARRPTAAVVSRPCTGGAFGAVSWGNPKALSRRTIFFFALLPFLFLFRFLRHGR